MIGDYDRAFEKLAAGCEPNQYLRELVHNAIYHGRASDVFVREDLTLRGKLSIIDNGVGISALEQSLALFTFSGPHAFDTFGIGGKIATSARSKSILYRTKANGIYRSLTLNLKPYGLGPGLPESTWPSQFGHGTIVTLLGMSEDDNTLDTLSDGEETAGRWAFHYLNRKFWHVPNRVNLTVFDRKPTRTTRACRGMEENLNDVCTGNAQNIFAGAHGVVKATPDYSVIWYLLPDRKAKEHRNLVTNLGITSAISRENPTFLSGGGLGILFENEVYHLLFGKEAGLRDFGIRCGHSRVLLFIKPAAHIKIEAELTRENVYTRDTANNEKRGIPIKEIAAHFAKNVPTPLQILMEQHESDSFRGQRGYVNDKLYRLHQRLLDPLKKGVSKAELVLGESEVGLPQLGLSGDPESIGGGAGGLVPTVNDRKDVRRHVLQLGTGRKKQVGCKQGPPVIVIKNAPLEAEFEEDAAKYAATFTFGYDKHSFEHCTLIINWDWPGWGAHVQAFERISRTVDKGEIIRRAVPHITSALLSGMEAVRVDGQPVEYLRDELATPAALTLLASQRNALLRGKDEYALPAAAVEAA